MSALLKYLIPVAIVAGIAWAAAWYMRPAPMPPGLHVEATPAPAVAKEPTVSVPDAAPPLVYKPAAKAKLKLPKAVVEDAAQHVVASSKTANDERAHTITTTLDASTGKFTTFDRTEPLPWVSVNTKSEVGVFYGIKGGDPVLRLQARQEFLQVKALHFGAAGSVDSDGSYFVGAGAWARF